MSLPVMSTSLQAVAAASSTLTQILPAAATIAGAIITGFGAASLKHRWDSRADDTRWQRERGARVRAQRLDAFARYLSARPDLNAVSSIESGEISPAAVLSATRLAAANLLILLSDGGQRAIVEDDLRMLERWLATWMAPSHSEPGDVPSADRILDLARELTIEPDEAA